MMAVCFAPRPCTMETKKTDPGHPITRTEARQKAPAAMDKEMPEYPMDANELKYPGEGSPFNSKLPGKHAAGASSGAMVPEEVASSSVKPSLTTSDVNGMYEVLTSCATACERCAEACRAMEDRRTDACAALSRACADLCVLLHTYIAAAHHAEIAILSKQVAVVCARACETCAMECSKHPDMRACVECEAACRHCAVQCRNYAA